MNKKVVIIETNKENQNHNEKVYAYKIKGTRHDIGNSQGWMDTIIDIERRSKTTNQ